MTDNKKPCVLVTGGAGYIGSHTVIELIQAGYPVVVLDNLVNSYKDPNGVIVSLHRCEEITKTSIPFYEVDLLDKEAVRQVFRKNKIGCVVHFAGLKAVGESFKLPIVYYDNNVVTTINLFEHGDIGYVVHIAGLKAVGESCDLPLLYYNNNLVGTITLLEVMKEFGVYNIVFSSSATVYGDPQYLPIDEKHPVGGCTNPYGKTKYFIEEMIKDLCKSSKQWNAVLLRYFNPIGAHISGMIGEDPQGHPNNLMPYVSQVAVGRRPELSVFGDDYDTPDGTGVRDYIHVVDLAQGHVAAIKKFEGNCGLKVYNLGTGVGYSVLQMVKAVEKASGKKVAYKICPRRPGDVATSYANPELAERELGWKAQKGLQEMCEDVWRWQSMNPLGFRGTENGTK